MSGKFQFFMIKFIKFLSKSWKIQEKIKNKNIFFLLFSLKPSKFSGHKAQFKNYRLKYVGQIPIVDDKIYKISFKILNNSRKDKKQKHFVSTFFTETNKF